MLAKVNFPYTLTRSFWEVHRATVEIFLNVLSFMGKTLQTLVFTQKFEAHSCYISIQQELYTLSNALKKLSYQKQKNKIPCCNTISHTLSRVIFDMLTLTSCTVVCLIVQQIIHRPKNSCSIPIDRTSVSDLLEKHSILYPLIVLSGSNSMFSFA